MLPFRAIGYGADGYARHVARRLRVLNIATFMAAALMTAFAAAEFLLLPAAGRTAGVAHAVAALLLALVPLLHRFGPLAAPIGFALIGYAAIFVIASIVGTGTGVPMQYLVAVAILVLILGAEHWIVSATLTMLAAFLIVLLQTRFPADTAIYPDAFARVSLVANVAGSAAILFAIVLYAVRDAARAEANAEREYQRSETLLTTILPASVARRLKRNPDGIVVDKYEEASVLFADLADFTRRAGEVPPEDLVRCLNRVFGEFDRLVDLHGLEKIKTSGDAYMVVSGVPQPRADHAEALADFALALRDLAGSLPNSLGQPTGMRIGIASGPVVAGVIGTNRMFYDVWGDTVNMASRMETTGPLGEIQVAPATRRLLADRYVFDRIGPVDVKGKGPVEAALLRERRKPD